MAASSLLLLNPFFVIAAVAAILYLYLKYQHTYWKRRGIPSLPGHWFYGNMKDGILMRRSPAMVMGDLYQQASENDDVLGIYVLHKPFLLLRSPELIKQILVKDFQYFSDRYFTAKSFHNEIGNSSLFAIKNPQWKYLRTKLTPVFTSGKMKNLFPLITEVAESMKNYLQAEFSNDKSTKTIMVKNVMSKYATDIISSVAFGIHVNSFDKSQGTFYQKAQDALKITFRRAVQFYCMFFFPSMAPILGGQMLGSATNYFRSIFWDSMDSRERTKSKRADLIDSLVMLKNEKQDNDFKFEGDHLVGQSAIFFVAGRETNVTTICFTLAELAKNPDIQNKTREEILEKLETHGLTYEGVRNMKYLNQVISEVLRLYPSAPLLDRVATVDYKVPGTDMVIEKGTPIYVILTGIQRDPKYYPDPLRFDPDRFSDENKDKIIAGTYMPFGEGPRACIGARLGMLQSAVGIITILKDYKVSLDPTYKIDVDRRNIFLSPPEEFKLRFTKL
ncbi:cytochrome P450 6k1 [Colletes latitarsis]|uniref:cytochrome P450 6k1 n=1 Tax=Colletes latitarsis TaxID=2605962 RepID=UPI0040358C63